MTAATDFYGKNTRLSDTFAEINNDQLFLESLGMDGNLLRLSERCGEKW